MTENNLLLLVPPGRESFAGSWESGKTEEKGGTLVNTLYFVLKRTRKLPELQASPSQPGESRENQEPSRLVAFNAAAGARFNP